MVVKHQLAHQHVIVPPSTLLANSATSVFMVGYITTSWSTCLMYNNTHYIHTLLYTPRASHDHGCSMSFAVSCACIAIGFWVGQVTACAHGMAMPSPPLPTSLLGACLHLSHGNDSNPKHQVRATATTGALECKQQLDTALQGLNRGIFGTKVWIIWQESWSTAHCHHMHTGCPADGDHVPARAT